MSRTGRMQEPTPTEVYPIMSRWVQAPAPIRLGRTEIEHDRNGAGQTDLAAVGMPAQQQLEPRMRGLPIDFRGMRQQDRKLPGRHARCRLFDIVDPVVVGIVDADEVNVLPAPLDCRRLVEQHPDPDLLQVRYHAYRVMVAQDAVHRTLEVRPHPRQALYCCLIRAVGLPAIIAGQDTQIVGNCREQLDQAAHRPAVHVRMQIAEMEDRKPVERARQFGRAELMAPNFDVLGIFAGAPIEPGRQ